MMPEAGPSALGFEGLQGLHTYIYICICVYICVGYMAIVENKMEMLGDCCFGRLSRLHAASRHMSLYIYVCAYVHVSVTVYAYAYIRVYVFVYIYIYICTCATVPNWLNFRL